MSEEIGKVEAGNLEDVYGILGKDKADELVAEAIGYRAATSPADTLAAVRAGACVEIEEYFDRSDHPERLVGEILEARARDPEYPSAGIRSWLADNKKRFGVVDDWMLSERDVTAGDVACLFNAIWSENGLWAEGFREREAIAAELIDSLEREGLDCNDLDKSDLAEELRVSLGLESVWFPHDGEAVGKIKFCQSVLVGDRGGHARGDDVARSRHAHNAAVDYLWALDEREEGEPMPVFGGGNWRADEDDVANSNLEWLCETQGTTLMDVLTPGSEAWDTPFAAALREEIYESSAADGWPYIAVLRETTVAEQLALTKPPEAGKDSRAGIAVKHATAGIFDPVNGRGGCLGLGDSLKPFCVPAPMVAEAMLDQDAGERHGVFARRETVDSVYGLFESMWRDSATSLVTGEDERLDAAYRGAERIPVAPADRWEGYGYEAVRSSLEEGRATIYARPREDGQGFHMVALARLSGETWGVASATLALSGDVDRANELLAAAGTSFDAASPRERMAALAQAAIDERYSPWQVAGSREEALKVADKEMRDEAAWAELSEDETSMMEDLHASREHGSGGER